MTFEELTAAIRSAKNTIQATDNLVGDMAWLLPGRLRSGNVSSTVLRRLKRELQDFDMRSGCWKDRS